MQSWLPFLAVFVLGTAYVNSYRVVCYWGTWSVYRQGDGKFDVSNIDPSLCTHLIYTFMGVGSDGSVKLLDSWNDIDLGTMKNFNAMKSSSTKTMVAIGGWNEGSSGFSNVVNSDSLRSNFVNNIVSFVKQYGFDGFDLDWEYPTQRGGASTDKAAFSKLLSELRPKFDANGYILSAAVSAGVATIDPAYDVPALSKYLDFINVMTYDMHGTWESVTGENAPLYSDDTLNVDYAIKYWIQKGADKAKINLGMGTYGHTWSLASSSDTRIGAATYGAGEAGPYTATAGTLGYNEFCEKKSQWQVYWNDQQQVPYAVKGSTWLGFDNIQSIGLKSQYIKDNGLGGAMIWSLETEDFLGKCGDGKYPLLNEINSVLNGKTVTQPSGSGSTGQTNAPVTQAPVTNAPVTNAPVPSGVCTQSGYVRDPNNCQVFYYCQAVNGQYVPSQFTCPAGTAYDTTTGNCNYTDLVRC